MPPAAREEEQIIELGVPLPPDGRDVWYFPGAADHGRVDLIARIRRRDGTAWIACLADDGSFARGGPPPAYVMPCGNRVYLSGGVADRDEPTSWRPLDLERPARVTWSADRRFAAFSDGFSLDVFGPHGRLWSARHVGDNSVLQVTADEVRCRIYDPATGDDADRRFDTSTGRVI